MGENTSYSCRICLQEIVETEKYYFLNDDDLKLKSKLLDFLPQIDLNITPNPITCNKCMITIEEIYEFKQLWKQNEIARKKLQQTIPFNDVATYVKKERIKGLIDDNIRVELSDLQVINNDCLEVNTDVPVCIEEPLKTKLYYRNCNFNTNKSLIRHKGMNKSSLKTHYQLNRYKCTKCNYTSAFKHTLQLHHLIHTNKKLYYCQNCDYSTNEKDKLIYHIIVHQNMKQFKCDFCNHSTHSRSLLNSHILLHKAVKVYKCDQCHFQSVHNGSLFNHMIVHSLVKPFVCETCDYSGRRQCDLKRHMMTHSSVKSVACETSAFSTKYQSNLKNQVEAHSSLSPTLGAR